MARETGSITLENLLSLALGTPEIGAVNFNYLFDVILQILKHLGISEKTSNQESTEKNLQKKSIEKVVVLKKSAEKVTTQSSHRMLSNPSPKDQPVELSVEVAKESPTLSTSPIYSLSPNGNENHSPNVSPVNRLESKPTNNMTQFLFINKRLEASESAIELMTSVIDSIRTDLEDLLGVTNEQNIETKTSVPNIDTYPNVSNIKTSPDVSNINTYPNVSKNIKNSWEESKDQMSELLRQLNERIAALELRFSMLQTKSLHLMDKDSRKTVSPIKENFELINRNDEEKIKEKSTNSLILTKINQPEEKQLTEMKSVQTSFISIPKMSTSSPELTIKGDLAEEKLSLVIAMIHQLETILTTKLDKQLFIDLEAGQKEINEVFQMFMEKFKDFQQELNLLERNYSSMSGELGGLSLKQEELEVMYKNLSNLIQKLEHSFEDMEENIKKNQADPFKMQSKSNSVDEGFITKIRSSIFDMQDQQLKLQHQIDAISIKSNDAHTKIHDVQIEIENLKENKIDKTSIEILLEKKADIQLLESKIDRNQFDAFAQEIERNFRSVVQKVDEAEITSNKTTLELRNSLDTKMDKEDITELRSYIDLRFSSFKPKVIQVKDAQDGAAGSRKQLMKNCNCISCDRPVAAQHIHPGGILPYYEPLPVTKPLHPVTPFELQTIRQQAQHTGGHGNNVRIEVSKERSKLQKELLQLCGAKDLDELSFQTNRACGGAHTLIEQHKRNPSKNPTHFREEGDLFQKEDKVTDVLGRDGHIYKGNLQTPLPAIPRSPLTLLETDTVELTDENSESILSHLSNHWRENSKETDIFTT